MGGTPWHSRKSLSLSERQDVVLAYACGAVAAIVIRYVASIAHPAFGHAVLALFAVAGILAAYLLIARADLEPDMKAAHIIGAAVVAGICFSVVSYLV